MFSTSIETAPRRRENQRRRRFSVCAVGRRRQGETLIARRSGRRLALAAVALFALAQGAALGATKDLAPSLTKPVNATKDDINPGRLYLAPALAIDPGNQLHVAAGMTELRTKTCFFMRSSDGGQTWVRPEASPVPASYPFCHSNNRGSYQAQVAFGRNGNLYMAFPGWDAQDAGGRGNSSLIVARSTDFGDSWTPVIARNNRGKQNLEAENLRPVGGIAVDTRTGSQDTILVTYGARQTNAAAPNASPTFPMAIVSTDGGNTWGEPFNLAPTIWEQEPVRQAALTARTTVPSNSPPTTAVAGSRAAQPNQAANFGGFSGVPAVAHDGTLYVLWPSSTANISPGIPTGAFISRSADKGKTWTTNQIGTFAYTNGSFVQLAWSPGGGSQGTLHAIYPGVPRPEVAGYSTVTYQRSTDGGRTFTDLTDITDDPVDQYAGQYYPAIEVSPNGERIDVTWYDTRTDPGYRSNEVFYAYSTDDGETWSRNIRVSDQPIDRRLGVWSQNYDITTPPSIASGDKYTLFGWDDTRNNDLSFIDNNALGGGAQDFYTVAAQYEVIGGGASKAAKYVVAGILGLVAVGLVLLLVSLAARGRSGATPLGTGRKDKAKAPAAKKPAEV